MKIKNEWWTCTFYPFYNFRTSKDLEILRQSSYMSHILKGLSKRNTHIPHIALYHEEKWQKMCSNPYFGVFTGGGHFWRVTQQLCTNVHDEFMFNGKMRIVFLVFPQFI